VQTIALEASQPFDFTDIVIHGDKACVTLSCVAKLIIGISIDFVIGDIHIVRLIVSRDQLGRVAAEGSVFLDLHFVIRLRLHREYTKFWLTGKLLSAFFQKKGTSLSTDPVRSARRSVF